MNINELENNITNVKNILKDTAIEQLGYVDQKNKSVIDKTVEVMWQKQQKLRLEITNSKDPEKYNELRQNRKQLFKQVTNGVKIINKIE